MYSQVSKDSGKLLWSSAQTDQKQQLWTVGTALVNSGNFLDTFSSRCFFLSYIFGNQIRQTPPAVWRLSSSHKNESRAPRPCMPASEVKKRETPSFLTCQKQRRGERGADVLKDAVCFTDSLRETACRRRTCWLKSLFRVTADSHGCLTSCKSDKAALRKCHEKKRKKQNSDAPIIFLK